MSSAQRARLFLALELPESARTALVRWRAEALWNAPALRLPAADHLHVTLCFLGWIEQSEIEQIIGACRAIANAPTLELRLGEAVWLPARRPRVLVVELEDPDGALARLQAAICGALADGGWYTPEKRPFLAHVTVARVPRGARPSVRELRSPPMRHLRGSQVTLFRSRLNPSGARYESLWTATLGT